MIWWPKCLEIFSWMANSGKNIFIYYLFNSLLFFRFGRNKFEEATKISNRTDIDWDDFKYMVFDVPNHTGPFSERYQLLGTYPTTPHLNTTQHSKHYTHNTTVRHAEDTLFPSFVEVAPKHECKDINHLETLFQDILDKEGEGIILRDPNGLYEAGRSRGFLKHKVYHSRSLLANNFSPSSKKFRDAEAKVVGVIGPGRYECQLYVIS